MASIRKRGKSWQVRHAGHSRTFAVKADAKRYALELERRDQMGSLYEAPPEQLGVFLDAYINRKRKAGLRAKTIENLATEVRHLRPLRARTIPSLRASEVEDLVLGLGARRRATRALALLKAVLRSARARGQSIDEAILELKPPRYEQREAKFLTLKELYELSSYMPEWCKRIVTVAGLTGLRQGELFDLRGEAQLNVELWAEVVDALMALDGPHSSRAENQAEAERDAAVEALQWLEERCKSEPDLQLACALDELEAMTAVLSGQEKQ